MYRPDRKTGVKIEPEGIDRLGFPYRVLVVDDEEITRRLVAQILRSAGYEVVAEAADGFQAIDQYQKHRPDIVTLDVQMPRMNGVYTLKAIRKIDPDSIVVLLTSVADRDVVVELSKAGAADYLVKPVERRTLLEKVKKARRDSATRTTSRTTLEQLKAQPIEPPPKPPEKKKAKDSADESKADDEAKAGDETKADDKAKAGDDTKADDKAKAGDETKAGDKAKAGDDTKADDDAQATEEPEKSAEDDRESPARK